MANQWPTNQKTPKLKTNRLKELNQCVMKHKRKYIKTQQDEKTKERKTMNQNTRTRGLN
jgi:hypothetical protein